MEKHFGRSSSSFRLFLSIISIVIVHGPHVRVCTRLSLLKSSKGTEKSRNVATVASVKIPSANMASVFEASIVKNTLVSRFTEATR